jgi:hypothetical protein
LQLAEAIAAAVFAEFPDRDAGAQAVLRTLFANDAWLCRYYESERGTIDVPLPPVQLGLPIVAPPGDRVGTVAETNWRERHEQGE